MLRIYGPKTEEVTGGWRKLHNDIMRSFIKCAFHQILIGSSNLAGRVHAWGNVKCIHNFRVEKPEGRDNLGDVAVDVKIILKLILKDRL
jgi:hypothetical protein